LPISDIGEDQAEPFVLDDRRLIDLLEAVKNAVRQITTLMTDRKTTVRIMAAPYECAGGGWSPTCKPRSTASSKSFISNPSLRLEQRTQTKSSPRADAGAKC
jgi:hypothetical protein